MRTSLGYAIKLVPWVDELQILNCGTAPYNRRFWCMLCDVQRASIDSGGFGSTPVWAFFFFLPWQSTVVFYLNYQIVLAKQSLVEPLQSAQNGI